MYSDKYLGTLEYSLLWERWNRERLCVYFCVLLKLYGSHSTVHEPTKSSKHIFQYKFESHSTIHIFKNYFAIVFLVFNFQFLAICGIQTYHISFHLCFLYWNHVPSRVFLFHQKKKKTNKQTVDWNSYSEGIYNCMECLFSHNVAPHTCRIHFTSGCMQLQYPQVICLEFR